MSTTLANLIEQNRVAIRVGLDGVRMELTTQDGKQTASINLSVIFSGDGRSQRDQIIQQWCREVIDENPPPSSQPSAPPGKV